MMIYRCKQLPNNSICLRQKYKHLIRALADHKWNPYSKDTVYCKQLNTTYNSCSELIFIQVLEPWSWPEGQRATVESLNKVLNLHLLYMLRDKRAFTPILILTIAYYKNNNNSVLWTKSCWGCFFFLNKHSNECLPDHFCPPDSLL